VVNSLKSAFTSALPIYITDFRDTASCLSVVPKVGGAGYCGASFGTSFLLAVSRGHFFACFTYQSADVWGKQCEKSLPWIFRTTFCTPVAANAGYFCNLHSTMEYHHSIAL